MVPGVGAWSSGVHGPGGGGCVCMVPREGAWSQGVVSHHALRQTTLPLGEMATAADGTHPTGMHSCFEW